MCGCAEALVRAVVAFFDAVLVDCFLSWFRHRPGPDSPASAHRDPLVPKDRGGEALPASDEEKGFAESTGSNEQLADGDDTDEELRREARYLKLCGTISQIPAELRNVSYESNSESANESDDMSINALAMGGTSVSGCNSSECFKCEEDLITELEISQDKSLDSVPRSVLRDKSPFWSM